MDNVHKRSEHRQLAVLSSDWIGVREYPMQVYSLYLRYYNSTVL